MNTISKENTAIVASVLNEENIETLAVALGQQILPFFKAKSYLEKFKSPALKHVVFFRDGTQTSDIKFHIYDQKGNERVEFDYFISVKDSLTHNFYGQDSFKDAGSILEREFLLSVSFYWFELALKKDKK
ncbi:MAG: hypothetical protein V4439_01770 [Patescibacteria group bacterium]